MITKTTDEERERERERKKERKRERKLTWPSSIPLVFLKRVASLVKG